MKTFFALIAACLLAACTQDQVSPVSSAAAQTPASTATTEPAPAPVAAAPTDPIAKIAAFSLKDLAVADALTLNTDGSVKDVLGHACYPALTKFVTDIQAKLAPANPGLTVAGAFSAFEKARLARLGIEANLANLGIPDYLKLGCAALVQDERNFVLRLAAVGAGASVLGPAGPAAIGGVLLRSLPVPLAPVP